MLVRVAVGLMLLCGFVGSSTAGTWRVEQDGSGDFTTIQPAVDAAASGDTILIGPGWYQDLHQVDHFGNPIEVAAYWLDPKDLTFIGRIRDEVRIGPAVYSPSGFGPQGILNEGNGSPVVVAQHLTFVNFYIGLQGNSVNASDCVFVGGDYGIVATAGVDCRVSDCAFDGVLTASCAFFSCFGAEVVASTLGQYVYFGDTSNGIVRSCSATGRRLCHYFASSGTVQDNVTDCYSGAGGVHCIAVTGGSDVEITGNIVSGGAYALTVDDLGSYASLHQNVFEGQTSHTILLRQGGTISATGNDFHRAQRSDVYFVWCYDVPWGATPMRVDMENNFWGYTNAYYLDRYIWDHNDDPSLMVEIDYDPFAGESVPAEVETWGSVKAQYLGR